MGQVPALCFNDNEGNSHVLTQVNSRSVVKWGASFGDDDLREDALHFI